jgi:hypothetical protein
MAVAFVAVAVACSHPIGDRDVMVIAYIQTGVKTNLGEISQMLLGFVFTTKTLLGFLRSFEPAPASAPPLRPRPLAPAPPRRQARAPLATRSARQPS